MHAYSRVSGGKLTSRSEAFLVGAPVLELGSALPLSHASEVAIAPSARRHLGADDAGLLGEERGLGFLCVPFEPTASTAGGTDHDFGRIETNLAPATSLPSIATLARQLAAPQETSTSSRLSLQLGSSPPSVSIKLPRMRRSFSLLRFIARPKALDEGSTHSRLVSNLVRFSPEFVKGRLRTGPCKVEHLAEHRHVSVLFIVGKMKVWRSSAPRTCMRSSALWPSLPGGQRAVMQQPWHD